MSVELSASELPEYPVSRSVAEIARTWVIDPRIPATVRGFDAPFFQAGLAGYSDGAMRLVARRHGCPFCVTEALLNRTLINGGKGRRKEDPDLLATECGMGEIEDNIAAGLDDHPIAGQVMGTTPDEMAQASELLVKMNYDVIDVNLACPVKKVKKSNRGGHFLAYPDDAIEILRAVRAVVPREIPCIVKLRRGFDDTPEMAARFEQIFEASYEIGFAWAVVHCRTVEQKYLGPGKWEFLRDLVARHPDRVIFGSGDVWTVDDIFRMHAYTGVHGVSVARGCIGNPWIFSQARALMRGEVAHPPTMAEQRHALESHFELALQLHGEAVGGRRMRKFGIKFASHHPQGNEVKRDFIDCDTCDDWKRTFTKWYA